MAEEEFVPVYEIEFTDTRTGQKVTARLGALVWDQNKDLYCCHTEIAGLEEGNERRAEGDGPFETIGNALQRFRKAFAKQTGDLRTAEGNSPHMLFPQEIPWVYGSDVYQRLCKMVDDEIQKIEDERTRRREARDNGKERK